MFEFLKRMFTCRISDEEFDELVRDNKAINCPNCGCYISRDIWEEEEKCPQCKHNLGKVLEVD